MWVVLFMVPSMAVSQQASRDTTVTISVRQAQTDRTKAIPIPAVEVSTTRIRKVGNNLSAPLSARELYSDDSYKSLTHDVRLTVPGPFSAKLSLNGLPMDQGARPYLWGHKIIGRTTLLLGGYSIVNPDLMDVELHPALMSHQFGETNGALEFHPRPVSDRPFGIVVSSDGVERRGTLSFASGRESSRKKANFVTSLRQNEVVGLLTTVVDALRVIPESVDSQTLATLETGPHKLQGFLRFGREKGDWIDPVESRSGTVHENNLQQLAFVQYDLKLPRSVQLGAGASWEHNAVDSKRELDSFDERIRARSEIFNPRITVSTGERKYTFWLGKTYATSDRRSFARYSGADGGVEGRFLYGQFTVEPSASFQRLDGPFSFLHGITVSVHPSRTTIVFGYGTYADYFVYDNGLFGSVFDEGNGRRPQRSTHYAVTVECRPEHHPLLDVLRFSAVRKDLDIVLAGRSDVQGYAADVTLAKEGNPGYEVAYAYNHGREDGGPLVGSVDNNVRLGMAYHFTPGASLSLEVNSRGGLVQENCNTLDPRYGERYTLHPATYMNVAANEQIRLLGRPMDITLTLFNVGQFLGNRAEIARVGDRSYTSPFWANLRLRWKIE